MRSKLLLVIATALIAATPALAADFVVTAPSSVVYAINGAANPVLALHRGSTYTFALNAAGHPFWIKSVQGVTSANAYNDGVTNNGIETGTLTFTVPMTAPSTLYYNCEFHAPMTNRIQVTTLAVASGTWATVKALFD